MLFLRELDGIPIALVLGLSILLESDRKSSSSHGVDKMKADIIEIFMQQFWYSIKKVQGTFSYEFLLANKKCMVNADVFRMILDICPKWKIPSKKSRGKGSQRKKTVDDSQETIDVSEKSEPEPEPLSKSISQTEAEEAEAARQVHATHARIRIESVLEPTKRRKSGKVTSDPPKKLKGVPSLTLEEQESEITEENVILEWGLEQESEYSEEDKLDDEEKDDKEGDADDKDGETESDEDDIYKYNIRVRKDEDEEMINAEVDDSNKGDEEITNATKADVENTFKVKDDPKKAELPPTSSSLSITPHLQWEEQNEDKVQTLLKQQNSLQGCLLQSQGLLTREGDTREEKRLRERRRKKSKLEQRRKEQLKFIELKPIPSTVGQDKGQREGKAPMIIEETPKKSKEQILQEEASLAEAIRLDSLQKEEETKQIHLDSLLAQRIAEEEELNEQQKKRKAQVQFEAQHYTNEDWDLIRAKIEANAELSKSMLGSDLQKVC
ncbi:hypothetical protein Tco_1455785 [Tanacetum coccineum]